MRPDREKLRRPVFTEIRERLSARPKHAWTPPPGDVEGGVFEIVSRIELAAAGKTFGHLLPLEEEAPARIERKLRVAVGGGYRRTESARALDQAPPPSGLEHSNHGALYLDHVDRTFLHFAPEQLAKSAMEVAPPKVELALEGSGKDGVILRIRGAIAVDVTVRFSPSDVGIETIVGLWTVILPHLPATGAEPFLLDKIVARGLPSEVRVFAVDPKRDSRTLLAEHLVETIRTGRIVGEEFTVPEGYRDLRGISDEPRRTCLGKATVLRERPRQGAPGRAAARAPQAATFGASSLQAMAPTLLGRLQLSEPVVPSCLDATVRVAAAYELRQQALDAIATVVNLIGRRLTEISGTTGAGEESQTLLDIDWLSQLETFHGAQGDAGDALFCLLRDTSGAGQGLLDKAAESLARQLLAEIPRPATEGGPVAPLGGADAPVVLSATTAARIAQFVRDTDIAPEERFDRLSRARRIAVRQAVLTQRIGRIRHSFDSDFGSNSLPTEEFELVVVDLRLEKVSLRFSAADLLRELRIVDGDEGPELKVVLALAGLSAEVGMERTPGAEFLITAAGVLIVGGIVAAATAGALIATLIGLGPFGLLLVGALVSQAPAIALATVAGGALLIGAIAYLVWDVATLRVELEEPVLTATLRVDGDRNPDEVVLRVQRARLGGALTASVERTVPNGIQQFFDAIANGAIAAFEEQIRDRIEEELPNRLADAIRRLPHLRLPTPFSARVPVAPPTSPDAPVAVRLPRHHLMNFADRGVEETLLSVAALTAIEFDFLLLAPVQTQVSPDAREALGAAILASIDEDRSPLLGYALSQNLLNGILYARWVSGRFAQSFGEDATKNAFEWLVAACPACGAVTDDREVHVWAASAPQFEITTRAYDEDARHPYARVVFPDVRACLSGTAGKRSSLEIRFAMTAIAHIAFGAAMPSGGRTLLSLEDNFIDVFFEHVAGNFTLQPSSTQSVAISGPGFAEIEELEATQRNVFLDALAPLMESAARSLLKRQRAESVRLAGDGTLFDRQVYDGFIEARLIPQGTTLLAIFHIEGAVANALPRRDADGTFHDPLTAIDAFPGDCARGRFLRSGE